MVRIYMKGVASGTLNPCAKILGFGSAPLKLQIEVTADTILHTARAAERQATKAMKAAAKKQKGTMRGLKYRLKDKESLVRKMKLELNQNRTWNVNNITTKNINDSLRYTIELSEKNYANGVKKVLADLKKQDYKVNMVKNYWNPAKKGKGVYKGINSVVTDPTGKKIELQFHTKQSLHVKEKVSHPIYQKIRKSKSAKKVEAWENTLRKAWEEDVRTPVGAMAL